MGATVYDAAGGSEAFSRLAAAHHARCLADPVLEHPFGHGVRSDHVERLGAYWAEVFGGPPRFSQVSDQSAMLEIHAHNGAEAELGDRFLACFLAAMEEVDLPADPELRAVLQAYMTWAVGEIMVVAPYDAVLPDQANVPRWSWDGLVETP